MPSTDIKKASLYELAARFHDATLGRIGTDEHEVCSILGEVYGRGSKDEFEAHIAKYETLTGTTNDSKFQSPVGRILSDEMSGTELRKAQDIWRDGKPSNSGSNVDYLMQGIVNGFGDIGELFYEHPVAATGATIMVGGVIIAGAVLEIPAIVIGSAILAIGVGAFEASSAVYHSIKATKSKNREKEVEHLKEAGKSISGFAMAATALKAASGPALRSAMGIGTAAKINTAAESGKQAPGAMRRAGAIMRALFSPTGKTCEKAAFKLSVQVTAAGGKKAQGEALRNLLRIPKGLGKIALDRIQLTALREIAVNTAIHSSVRREALIALDRAGALRAGLRGRDIHFLGRVLLDKSPAKVSIATDRDAALLLDYAVQILAKSKDPRALDIMKATYWKNLHGTRLATGQNLRMSVLDDLATAIIKKDPSFRLQQKLYSLGAHMLDSPGKITPKVQAEYLNMLMAEKNAPIFDRSVTRALNSIAGNEMFPNEVGQKIFELHRHVAWHKNGMPMNMPKGSEEWRILFGRILKGDK